MRSLLALVVAAATLGACIPVPTVTPPIKAKLGGGLGVGSVTDEPNATADPSSTGVLNVSVGVHPLQYWEEAEGFDLGAGFVMDVFLQEALKEQGLAGAYLEGGYVVWKTGEVESGQGRLTALLRGDLLTDTGPASGTGLGLAAGLSLEFVSWQESGVASTSVTEGEDGVEVTHFIGVAYGESSIGVEATGNIRQFQGQKYSAFMVHIIFRVPTIAGFYLIPLF